VDFGGLRYTPRMLTRRCLAEFIGTFMLVFAGCGAMAVDGLTGGVIGHAGVALTWGLIVMVVIYAIGDFSGAHINPAVTGAFWLSGRLPGRDVLPYIVTQFAGATAAAFSLLLLLGPDGGVGETRPNPILPGSGIASAFVIEVLLTLGLMYVILCVSTGAKEKGITAAIAIGGTVGLEAMFAGPVTNASMNPARSLGPALAGDGLDVVWIYLVACTLGAFLAVGLFRLTHGPDVITGPCRMDCDCGPGATITDNTTPPAEGQSQ